MEETSGLLASTEYAVLQSVDQLIAQQPERASDEGDLGENSSRSAIEVAWPPQIFTPAT